jgi:transposase
MCRARLCRKWRAGTTFRRSICSPGARRRKAARAGLLSLPADEAPLFVPVVTQPRRDGATAAVVDGSGGIAIEIGGVVVRAARGVDLAWLRDVLRAVKAAT